MLKIIFGFFVVSIPAFSIFPLFTKKCVEDHESLAPPQNEFFIPVNEVEFDINGNLVLPDGRTLRLRDKSKVEDGNTLEVKGVKVHFEAPRGKFVPPTTREFALSESEKDFARMSHLEPVPKEDLETVRAPIEAIEKFENKVGVFLSEHRGDPKVRKMVEDFVLRYTTQPNSGTGYLPGDWAVVRRATKWNDLYRMRAHYDENGQILKYKDKPVVTSEYGQPVVSNPGSLYKVVDATLAQSIEAGKYRSRREMDKNQESALQAIMAGRLAALRRALLREGKYYSDNP